MVGQDVEATLAEMIAKGEELETGVLSQFAAQLPPEVMEAIPAELKDAFPGLKTAGPSEDPFADEWETKYDDSYTYTPPPVAPPSSAPPPSSPAGKPPAFPPPLILVLSADTLTPTPHFQPLLQS